MGSSIAKYSFLPWVRQGLSSMIIEPDVQGKDIPYNAFLAKERANVLFNLDLKYSETEETAESKIQITKKSRLEKKVQMFGPGDILGINPDALIKVHPKQGVNNFESNYLAFAEFYEEDFPWRFTPAKHACIDPHAQNVEREFHKYKQLSPWIALVVVKEDEYNFDASASPLPIVSIKAEFAEQVFYDQKGLYAWAHVHVNKFLEKQPGETHGDLLKNEVDQDPDVAFSRLICPRKLEKPQDGKQSRKYHAFIIPSYETGRLAGLGIDCAEVFAQEPAWRIEELTTSSKPRPLDFPVYYHWEFRTGSLGDFETLVSLLEPKALGDEFGKRAMRISQAGFGLNNLPDSDQLGFEGALRPPFFESDIWPKTSGDRQFTSHLKKLLNLSEDLQNGNNQNPLESHPIYDGTSIPEDPIVTPPIYGKWHATIKRLGEKKLEKPWINELNIDPRYRAAAALGAKVVRENQEKFMEMAWDQVGEILEANQKIRETEMAIQINEAIYNKHIQNMDKEKVMAISDPVHKYLVIDDGPQVKTVNQRIHESKIPDAAKEPAFRRIARPRKKMIKGLLDNEGAEKKNLYILQNQVFSKFNQEELDATDPEATKQDFISAAKRKVTPDSSISFELARAAIGYHIDHPMEEDIADKLTEEDIKEAEKKKNNQEGYMDVFNAIADNIGQVVSKESRPILENLDDFSQKLKQRLNPKASMRKMLAKQIQIDGKELDTNQRVMAYPKVEEPMYTYLQKLSPDYIIPNYSDIPENCITLLESNQKFIESFMLGLNHEMSSELMWREFPTDQRGSYFRNFWDDKDNLNKAFVESDIGEISGWNKELGDHSQRIVNTSGQVVSKKIHIVLVIRGELLRKYPNTIIYAQRGQFADSQNQERKLADKNPGNVKYPIYQGEMKPDISMIGFDLTSEEVLGDARDAGWFFVLQERPGQIQFGLDEPIGAESFELEIPQTHAKNWNELTWGHLVPADGGLASLRDLKHIPLSGIRESVEIATPAWGHSSAEMASILYQNPVLFARHASQLLPKK